MRFEKGNKIATGRPKGGIGERKRRIEELAKEIGVDPIEILLRVAKADWKGLGYKTETITKYNGDVEWEEDRITLTDRIQASKEAAQYMYAKLKTIEVIKENANAFDGMTLEEKLQAMKHAVVVLEKQVESQQKVIE